jgi:hypothetical protein
MAMIRVQEALWLSKLKSDHSATGVIKVRRSPKYFKWIRAAEWLILSEMKVVRKKLRAAHYRRTPPPGSISQEQADNEWMNSIVLPIALPQTKPPECGFLLMANPSTFQNFCSAQLSVEVEVEVEVELCRVVSWVMDFSVCE